MTDEQKIDKLVDFKQRNKFSIQVWNERGLNPSSDELCQQLTLFFNSSSDNLISGIKSKKSVQQLKSMLKSELSSLNKLDYDTEEKEFICDLFNELATIIEIDFNSNLNKWLYGSVLTTLMKIQNFIKPVKIVETLKHSCTKCSTVLETQILSKESGIPETCWPIVKCNSCGELNMLSLGPNVKETRFVNYKWVDSLHMKEYTYEQALTRLEQIKFFRK
ncbi:DUF4844 domain-containing protein [Pedobacter sp. B4-66]|uniref:DUF4844 domain-containing protein n=1 Tax=Pedobacter sp. B4-66 TaxID=2817280 RepID=UPI001BD963EF|nr:DUF4844 domain-containing protein [Pedobacter sp. B4-66]